MIISCDHNFVFVAVSTILIMKYVFQSELCNKRGNRKTSVCWCVNCEESSCTGTDCTENHQVMRLSASHNLIDISEKPTETQLSAQSCLKHDALPFKYFCIDHHDICCNACLFRSHRTCTKAMSKDIASSEATRSQSFKDSTKLIKQVLETVNEVNKYR